MRDSTIDHVLRIRADRDRRLAQGDDGKIGEREGITLLKSRERGARSSGKNRRRQSEEIVRRWIGR